MLNRVPASVPMAACASLAVALVFALMAACGPGPDPAAEPAAAAIAHFSMASQSPTSTEELVFLSEIVARVRLVSVEPGSRLYLYGQQRPVFVFRFRVVEYLKGSGNDELTVNLIAESPDGPFAGYHYTGATPMPTPDAEEALRTAKSRLAQRDARWDNREALIFLNPSTIPGESGAYEFAGRYATTALYNYAVTSEYNRAWLPATAPSKDKVADAAIDAALDSSEPHYLTGEPFDTAQPQAPGAVAESVSPTESSAAAISLSEVKSLIEANDVMLAKGEGVPGYEDCVKEMFEFDADYKESPLDPYIIERHIPSGQPAGYRLWPNLARYVGSRFYNKWWTAGEDTDLFIIRITDDPDNDPTTGYAHEEVATRPIPKGNYNVFIKAQSASWVPCDYNPEESAPAFRDMRITATAPDGVVHESFFDPADMKGGAIGANGSNGVLKPTDFTFNGASVSLDSIRWDSQAVEMRLSPHTRLANHHADFIAPDGSIALRLDFDDASETGAGANRALKWNVCVQRWSDGDMLMLRLSESPADLIGATRDADCLATPALNAN